MTTPRMASELAERLIAHVVEVEAMRDRYSYRGNDKYPRKFPSDKYAALDSRAKDLREAAARVAS